MLQAVEPRRVDLAIQPSGRPVVHPEEAKESSQRTDIVLETCSIQPCTGLGDMDLLISNFTFIAVVSERLPSGG